MVWEDGGREAPSYPIPGYNIPMRKNPARVWMILFVGLALLALVSVARLNSGRDRIPWRSDFSAAQRESAMTHRPIFLDFTASWCGPCQSLKTSTWADSGVAAALGGYVPVSVDLDANPELAKQYHVSAIPMFVVLDAQGNSIKSSLGYLEPDQFLQWLKN